ncbi:MAG: hypothetical protein CMB80_01835 [Flammeovirgaceae bacterium]|nr:hypothetical protein [Flammeovirgaceae bacterium]|tara:strand:+ start:196 stop:630 length:435 start_codon:yes stop_codon:yes gene_type:complete
MARPTKYNEERAKQILDLYSSGMNLQQVEKKKNLPSRRTICRWRKDFPEFGEAYDIALQAHSEAIVEESMVIADTEQDAKKAKNRIDIRTWIASKLNRKRFGDRLDIDIKQTLDVSPVISKALERLSTLRLGEPKEQVLEANTT